MFSVLYNEYLNNTLYIYISYLSLCNLLYDFFLVIIIYFIHLLPIYIVKYIFCYWVNQYMFYMLNLNLFTIYIILLINFFLQKIYFIIIIYIKSVKILFYEYLILPLVIFIQTILLLTNFLNFFAIIKLYFDVFKYLIDFLIYKIYFSYLYTSFINILNIYLDSVKLIMSIVIFFINKIFNNYLHLNLFILLIFILIVNFIISLISTLIIAAITLLERKLLSIIQRRVGPNFVGYRGRIQYIADALKLIFKETIIPKEVNKFMFIAAPSIICSICYFFWINSVWGPNLSIFEIEYNLVYLSILSIIFSFCIILSGYISKNKYSLLGSVRSLILVLNLEIFLGLLILNLVLFSESFCFSVIVIYQESIWFFWLFFNISSLIFITFLLETNRAPFDLPEAESELVGGYHTEYGGFLFALYYLGEYFHLFFFSAVISLLFFGGWFLPNFPAIILNSDILTQFSWSFNLVYMPVITHIENYISIYIKTLPHPRGHINYVIIGVYYKIFLIIEIILLLITGIIWSLYLLVISITTQFSWVSISGELSNIMDFIRSIEYFNISINIQRSINYNYLTYFYITLYGLFEAWTTHFFPEVLITYEICTELIEEKFFISEEEDPDNFLYSSKLISIMPYLDLLSITTTNINFYPEELYYYLFDYIVNFNFDPETSIEDYPDIDFDIYDELISIIDESQNNKEVDLNLISDEDEEDLIEEDEYEEDYIDLFFKPIEEILGVHLIW